MIGPARRSAGVTTRRPPPRPPPAPAPPAPPPAPAPPAHRPAARLAHGRPSLSLAARRPAAAPAVPRPAAATRPATVSRQGNPPVEHGEPVQLGRIGPAAPRYRRGRPRPPRRRRLHRPRAPGKASCRNRCRCPSPVAHDPAAVRPARGDLGSPMPKELVAAAQRSLIQWLCSSLSLTNSWLVQASACHIPPNTGSTSWRPSLSKSKRTMACPSWTLPKTIQHRDVLQAAGALPVALLAVVHAVRQDRRAPIAAPKVEVEAAVVVEVAVADSHGAGADAAVEQVRALRNRPWPAARGRARPPW